MVETGHFATLWHKMATKLGLKTEFLATDWRRGVDPQAVEDRLRAILAARLKLYVWSITKHRPDRPLPLPGAAASILWLMMHYTR